MSVEKIEQIIVIGSGNWGLALACLFCKNLPVRVWTLNAHIASEINASRKCPGGFYRFPLPDELVVEEKYSGRFDPAATLFIMAVPSSQMDAAAAELGRHAKTPLVLSVSKGFDARQLLTMSGIIQKEIPGAVVTILTGPTIANEVAEGKPTRAILAGDDLMHLALVKNALKNDVISFEVSRNPAHHEICGALKGLVAIAVGMAEGLNLGANMQGVIMLEGIRELAVVASFFGIPHEAAYSLSGMGDLITTCVSRDSRNRMLGVLLAQGLSVSDALQQVRMTVEGIAMSQTIETLWALDVSIPLVRLVNGALLGRRHDLREELCALIRTL
jgi:glycerol-3-phosphate dehydrogenase (NAD(P)+)